MKITWVYNSHCVGVMNQPMLKDMMMNSSVWHGFEIIKKGNLKKNFVIWSEIPAQSTVRADGIFSYYQTQLSFNCCTLEDKT